MFEDDWVSPAPGFEALDDAVEAWAEHACPHPRLRLVDGQVVGGPLRRALADHGYPALVAALPTHNWGSVSPDQARACLAELARLSGAVCEPTMVIVVDVADGAVIRVLRDDGVVGRPQRYLPRPGMLEFDGQGRVHGLTTPSGTQTTVTWLGTDAVLRVRGR